MANTRNRHAVRGLYKEEWSSTIASLKRIAFLDLKNRFSIISYRSEVVILFKIMFWYLSRFYLFKQLFDLSMTPSSKIFDCSLVYLAKMGYELLSLENVCMEIRIPACLLVAFLRTCPHGEVMFSAQIASIATRCEWVHAPDEKKSRKATLIDNFTHTRTVMRPQEKFSRSRGFETAVNWAISLRLVGGFVRRFHLALLCSRPVLPMTRGRALPCLYAWHNPQLVSIDRTGFVEIIRYQAISQFRRIRQMVGPTCRLCMWAGSCKDSITRKQPGSSNFAFRGP